jgi:diphthamide synthase subunit DPH2
MWDKSTLANTVRFGVLAPPLKEQLDKIGYRTCYIKRWQKIADAIVRLKIERILSVGETQKARRRLLTKIAKAYAAYCYVGRSRA